LRDKLFLNAISGNKECKILIYLQLIQAKNELVFFPYLPVLYTHMSKEKVLTERKHFHHFG